MQSHAPAPLFPDPGPDAWATRAEKELGISSTELSFLKLSNGKSLAPYYKKLYLEESKIQDIHKVQKKQAGFLSIAPVYELSQLQYVIDRVKENWADEILVNLENWPMADLANLGETISRNPGIPFHFQFDITDFQSRLSLYNSGKGWSFDPIMQWMCGQGPYETSLSILTSIIKETHSPTFTPLEISAQRLLDGKVDSIQELSLTVAALVTYLDYFTDQGLSAATVFKRISYSIQVGNCYIQEISKLRALRVLIHRVASYYNLPISAPEPFIKGRFSLPNEPAGSDYFNLAHMSCQAMSMTVGGCDAMVMVPFSQQPNQNRHMQIELSLNIPLILRNEVLQDRVGDPSAGSYLIDTATLELAESAWSRFLEIEEQGGLIPCYESGSLQKVR
ncbi:methylmalonyl-CoA mutase family protein [Dyadobacter tibetensis]|uniref:methylmalonyl-CoA mutase family protein n=1 Tax=Dyadobacter tibetensis TaxID=1211851 RepID=UPI000470BF3F|nr:methylmalonyl-CoA mutase family protein [Dyadobacter tibetensis]